MHLHGWVIYNGHLAEHKFLDYAEWIKQAAAKQDITIDIKKNNQLLSILDMNTFHFVDTLSANKPDFVLFADKDIALARQLEYIGIPVFNSAESIEISDNKISTYQRLTLQRLPIPKTIVGPKVFPGVRSIDIPVLDQVIEELGGFPLIIKEAYGSFGEQVYLIDSKRELQDKINSIEDRPILFQQFISTSYGKDVRLNVVGDEVVASMLRQSSGDFRANVSVGGTMQVYQPSHYEKQLAIAATKAIGADFAGIDLLFGENGPVICEINSNAHIRNIYECTGVNVADFMIKYVVEKLGEGE
ncbi:RimK family alpha-L-glutamate ligase [Radiobacillus sp. PE A8.2]|uniref:ATP-grasp domain-containing protein n=1 Tax=Radiobacillus sp. PE A8.2 TaxID=3380349 RepID=UPI00388CEF58